MQILNEIPEGWEVGDFSQTPNQKSQNALAAQGAPAMGAPTPDQGITTSGDGSIWNTMKSKWSLDRESILAANATDPTLSNYSRKRAKNQLSEYQRESGKLSTAENLIAGIGGAVPAIAAGIVNPLLGGAVAMGQGYADTLSAQLEEQGDFNNSKALTAGAAMGLLDAATGRIANTARAALPFAKPAAQMAARVGVNTAEDVTSNVGAQAFENLASGRDWSTGLAEAGMFGAAGGATVRGGLAGLNKAMGYNVNKGGEGSINSLFEMNQKGYSPNEDFQGNAFGYENMKSQMDTELAGTDLTGEGLTQAGDIVNRQIDLAMSNGGDSATMKAFKLMNDGGLEMIDSAYDVDVPMGFSRNTSQMVNIGEQLGLTKEQMRQAGIAQQQARAGKYSKEAVDKGLTKDSDELKFQNTYKDKVYGPALGTFDTNFNYVKSQVMKAEQDGMPRSYVDQLKAVQSDLGLIRNMAKEATGQDKTDVTDSLRITLQRLKPLVNRLGLQGELVGIDGKRGSWDAPIDIMTLDRMGAMAKARMPSINQGTPNKYRSAAGDKSNSLGTTMDAMSILSGNFFLPIARRAGMGILNERGARKSQKSLAKVKKVGADRLKTVVEGHSARVNEGIKAGDIDSAAQASARALQESGINTAGMGEDLGTPIVDMPPMVDTAPIETPIVSEPLSAPRKSSVAPDWQKRKPLKKTEPTPEPEAPKTKPSTEMAPRTGSTKGATKKAEAVVEPEVTVVETPEPAKPKRKLNARQAKKVQKKEEAKAPESDSKPLSRKEKRKLRALERKARRERPEDVPAPKEADLTDSNKPETIVVDSEGTATSNTDAMEAKQRSKLQIKAAEVKAKEAPQPEATPEPETSKPKGKLSAKEPTQPKPKETEATTEEAPVKEKSKLKVKAAEVKQKEAETDVKEEVKDSTPEPEPEAKPSSKVPARKPEQKAKETAPEEPVRAPETKPNQPLPRQPKAPEKAPEVDTEAEAARAEAEAARTKAEEELAASKEPVKPKGPDFAMANRALLDREQELRKSAKGKVNSQELAGKIAVVQDQISTFNTETSRLAKSFTTDKDEIARRIDKLGGIGESMANAKALGMTTHDYLMGKIRDQIADEKVEAKTAAREAQDAIDAANRQLEMLDLSDAERKQALDSKSAAEEAAKAGQSEWQRKLAAKRNQVQRRLDAAGYDQKIIDQAMKDSNALIEGEDFDATEVMTRARTLNRRALEDAQKVAKEKADADSKAAEAAKQTLGDSKAQLRTLLKGLKVQDHPEIRKLMKNYFGNRDMKGKPLTDAQRATLLNKADEIIKAEIDGLQKALSRPKTLDPVQLANLRQQQAVMREEAHAFSDNKSQYENLIKTAGENLDTVKMTAKERAKAEAEVQRIRKETEAKEAAQREIEENAAAVDKQSNDMIDELTALNVGDDIIQKVIWKNFGAADKPLNRGRLQKVKQEAVREQERVDANNDKERQKLIKKLEEELRFTLKKVPQDVIEEATDPLISKAVSTKDPETSKVIIRTVKEALTAAGKADHVAGVEAFQRGMEASLKRKFLYPDNPELWVSRDDITDIQDALNFTSGKSYSGNLSIKLRAGVTGDSEYNARYTRDEIAKRVASLEAKRNLGDEDIRVGDSKVRSWK